MQRACNKAQSSSRGEFTIVKFKKRGSGKKSNSQKQPEILLPDTLLVGKPNKVLNPKVVNHKPEASSYHLSIQQSLLER